MADARDQIRVAVLRWALGVESDAAQELDRASRNFEGDVKGSLYSRADLTNTGVVGVIGAASDHAIYAHEGRRPGKQPPTAALVPWVRKKLNVEPARARSVAFLVARKIGRRGTRGTPFLARPFRESLPALERALAGAAVVSARDAFPPQSI
jgi:hypothetical protein